MSPRQFDGWEPREVHEHHYDDDGRMVRTIVRHEPLWDDTDRARALELEEVEAGICPCGCGQPLRETLEEGRGFNVEVVKCRATAAIKSEKRKAEKAAEQGNAAEGWDDGLYWLVTGSVDPKPGKESEDA